MKILLVEDDFDVAKSVCEYLEASGHEVELAPDGLIGLDSATRERYDGIILDIFLPRLSGIQLCERIRALGFSSVPILMLTAMGTLSYKEDAFNAGADDYLVKPFALKELELRLSALTRRVAESRTGKLLRVGDLSYDVMTQEIRRADKAISLAATSRKILELLMRNPHRVVSKQEIEQLVWGEAPESGDLVRIHIHTLREAIDKPFDHALLQTIRGMGYRLTAEHETSK
ncbi:MAG: response regulator transcription factor [Gammaproteobacteria bacterium]|nr:response regulator transcription factor [Gammaproteobacteria bacterium]